MPKNSKSTPTKEADEAAARYTEIAQLKELLKLRDQELAALRAPDGVISTPAATTDPWRDWRNLSNPPPVTSQAGSARTLDLNLEEEKDTLTQVKRILDQKTTDKSFIMTPKFAEGTNDSVKHLRSVINADTDFDRTGYVKTIMTVISTFAGRPLSPAHVDSPALEQLAIVLAAQRVSNVHT